MTKITIQTAKGSETVRHTNFEPVKVFNQYPDALALIAEFWNAEDMKFENGVFLMRQQMNLNA